MNYNDIKVLYFLIKTHSVQKTADRLSVSQPAISNAIKRIESQYGEKFFISSNKGLTLTPFAHRHEKQFMAFYERLGTSTQSALKPTIRLGISKYFGELLFKRYSKDFLHLFSDYRIYITIHTDDTLEKRLKQHKLDAVYTLNEEQFENCVRKPLEKIPIKVIAHSSNASIDDLADKYLLVTQRMKAYYEETFKDFLPYKALLVMNTSAWVHLDLIEKNMAYTIFVENFNLENVSSSYIVSFDIPNGLMEKQSYFISNIDDRGDCDKIEKLEHFFKTHSLIS